MAATSYCTSPAVTRTQPLVEDDYILLNSAENFDAIGNQWVS